MTRWLAFLLFVLLLGSVTEKDGMSAESAELMEDNDDSSLTQSQEMIMVGGGISLQIQPLQHPHEKV